MAAIDPLFVINSALINTGQNPRATAFDGSDEWTAGYNAYQIWLPYALEAEDWNFQTAIVTLQRTGNSNDPVYADVYAKPPDCLHLLNVWRTDLAVATIGYQGYGQPADDLMPPLLDYRIIGDAVHTTAPAGATAKYVQQPTGAQNQYSAMFTVALIKYVTAHLFASLNEEFVLAKDEFKDAAMELGHAAARTQQQEPRRAGMRSNIVEARRARGRGGWGW